MTQLEGSIVSRHDSGNLFALDASRMYDRIGSGRPECSYYVAHIVGSFILRARSDPAKFSVTPCNDVRGEQLQ